MHQDIISRQNGSFGIVALNRPRALNALTLQMIDQLHRTLSDWERNEEIKALFLHSSETKSYCAGGDIRWLFESGKNHDPRQLQFFRDEYRLNYRMAHYPKPIIALVSGVTMGGGIGISLHASLPVASHDTVFAMPETSIGFFPDIGASYLLSRCPGATGMYLALTGARFSAYEAQFLGLLTYVVNQESLELLSRELFNLTLEDSNQAAIEQCVASYRLSAQEPSDIECNYSRINEYFALDSLECVLKKLADSEDPWAQKTLEILKSKSPLSLKVTFMQMKQATNLTLRQCLEMDYILAQNFMHSHDFYEGVRAMVIDKDKNPHWCPVDINAISDEMVNSYFEIQDSALNINSLPELVTEA